MKRRILPPTYFQVLLLLSIGVRFVFPILKFIPSPYKYLGSLFIVFGIVLNLWADALFKKRRTPVKPHDTPTSLEISGPFRISRHPMYLGMTAILLGTAIILGSLIPFGFSVLFIVFMEILFIPVEEKNLEKVFGETYLDYKKRVRRWL